MKLFASATLAAILLIVGASADDADQLRNRRHSGGGLGKLSPDRLQSMLDSECPAIECNGDTRATSCTFDKPERPDLSGLDEDAILELKAEFKAMKEDFKQKLLECGCCSEMSAEDIFSAIGKTGSSLFEGDGSSRPSGGFGGRPGGKLSHDKLQTMVDTKCPAFDCEGNTAETLTCTFEKPDRPDMTGLDEDAISELKSEYKAKKKDFKQKLIQCACCAEMSVEDILASMGKAGDSSYPGAFDKNSMGDVETISSTSGDDGDDSSSSLSADSYSVDLSESIPGSEKEAGGELGAMDNDADMFDSSSDGSSNSLSSDGPSMMSDSSSDMMLSSAGPSGRPGSLAGGRPQGGGQGGGGRDIQAMLAEKCQEIDDEKCAAMASQNIDCDRFDSIMTANTRGKFKKILYCGCCRD